MGRQEMSTALPEVLVERILAMVPFPNIFKARVLSKSWLARLSPVSSQDGDEEKKRLAVAFQKIVSEYSSKWTTFCPVFVGTEDFIVYEESSQHWRSIPTLSFLPSNHLLKSTRSDQRIRGALSLIKSTGGELFVVNVLTRSCKRLPPFAPEHEGHEVSRTVVSDRETYSVIRLREVLNYCLAEIYDSQSDSWRSKRLDLSKDFQIDESYGDNAEFLNGVLYWVGADLTTTFCLIALNVREGTFKSLQMASPNIQHEPHTVSLVACNGSLLMVAYHDYYGDPGSVTLRKADLGLQRWLKVSEGPPTVLKFGPFQGPTSNGNCIYFVGKHLNKVLAYNVRKDEWSSFLIPEIVRRRYNIHCEEYQLDAVGFEPGLNPFVAV